MKTKKLAVGGICAALSVVLLAVGSLIQTLDIALAVTASVVIFALIIDYDSKTAFSVFFVTSILSLLLLPYKTTALMYALFFGWYAFAKRFYERFSIVVSWILKVITFNIAVGLYYIAAKYILELPADIDLLLILSFALANIVFILYDICCTRFVVFYVRFVSPRLARFIRK